MNGAWSSGYVYHGNADETFRQFFGGDNPFAGNYYKTGLLFLKKFFLIQISRDNLVQSSHKFTVFIIILWRFEESKL